MKTEKRKIWIKYAVCLAVAALITLIVFAIKGFFTDRIETNIGILADGFTVSGLLLTLFAGMLFVSGEGAFIGIGFVLRNVVLALIPMGRRRHEVYAQYRERKLNRVKKQSDHCILIVGLVFLAIGILFTVIWYTKYYQIPA